MQSNVQITVKGLENDFGNEIAHALDDLIKALADHLDFRRMRRIIVTTDFDGELKELSTQTASGNAITHTNEEYAVAVAKVMLLPLGEEYEIVPVINANIVSVLVAQNSEDFDEDRCKDVIHYLHHEFCHVHDDNKKIDALREVMLNHRYVGKEIFIRPLAEICWSEYLANRLSSASATKTALSDMTTSFKEALIRTKPVIDKEIVSYRYHHDLNRLMDIFQRHGEFLVKSAAYVLGYLDGLGEPLSKLSAECDEKLNGSYFQHTWEAIHQALQEMHKIYPQGWKSLEVYDRLAEALEHYYAEMGLVLSTTNDGGAYVNVPFRSETTPPT
jgi:nucleotide-binding universal stress UspA family protein